MPVLSKLVLQISSNRVLSEQILSTMHHRLKRQCLFCSSNPIVQPHHSSFQMPQSNKFHSDSHSSSSGTSKRVSWFFWLTASLAGAGAVSWWTYTLYHEQDNSNIQIQLSSFKDTVKSESIVSALSSDTDFQSAGCEIPSLPTYTSRDVAAHDSLEKGIWVCYKSGVYDITKFLPKHPGGDKILMAAGGALEPFWELFAIHKNPKILKMLEEYRIGNLHVEDRGLHVEDSGDPYARDPQRHPVLKPGSRKPFNAEPPPDLLVENFITPNEIFFVRNHLPVPDVDPDSYELEIAGLGIQPIHLTLQELKTKFKKQTIVATLQCAGNRRSELNKVAEVKGLNWGSAAISTAEWSGVKLVDVLRYAKVNFEDKRIHHIQFEALDTDPANMPYGASIPAEKGLDPNSDVLLAYEMNGKVLPRDHGYPVRVVVPGVVGARNVKWLAKIEVSSEESNSHWQQGDYKGFSPNTTWENVDFSTAPAIQELPVNSAVCKPQDGNKVQLQDNKVVASGYAWSGGGRKIVRVDVSADGGKTWHTASLKQDASPLYRSWAWTLWDVSIPIPKEYQKSGSKIEIICKAVDSSYNVQPDSFPPIWNLRGVLGNAWHRINVEIK